MTDIKILVADDHALFREGISLLLTSKGGMRVAGEASSGPEVVVKAGELKPDVILLDLAMPGGNGIDSIPRLREGSPASRIIAVSSHTDELMIREVLEKGAAGYVCKDDAFSEVYTAILQVLEGRRYLSPRVADVIYSSYLEKADVPVDGKNPLLLLTDRERTILRLLCEGKYPKTIGLELGISRKTVDVHKRNMMIKLHTTTDAGLIKIGIESGIFPDSDKVIRT